mgnify:CR=1 FL=1
MPPDDVLGIGFSLHGDGEFLELTRPLIEGDADYFEVAPEALWRRSADGIEPNAYFELFAELKRRSGRPFVAHALQFSLGTDPSDPGETERLALWMEGLATCHETFEFEWFSDHLGFMYANGINRVFPLPLPMTEEAVRRVGERLRAIGEVVPVTAFENGADAFRGTIRYLSLIHI